MKTRERFWIIHGISVKYYIANCGKCALKKAKPVRQLMADLPSFRVTACNKPFKFTGLDYLGPYILNKIVVTGRPGACCSHTCAHAACM